MAKKRKSKESASNSLVTHRMSIDQRKCLLVSATSEKRVSLVNSVNINQPKCTMWDCYHNRWQEVCSRLLRDAAASTTTQETTINPTLCLQVKIFAHYR